VRHELRAQDDGYSSPLVPGLHASADAERLAGEIAFSRARLIGLSLAPPGRYAEAKELATSDLEQATLICFDLAATPATPATSVTSVTSVTSEEPDRLAERREAYRGWIERSGGSQAEAFRGDPSWTPERRFDRLFERLALPGFPRGPRYELLVILGRLGLYELRAGSLQFAGAAGSGDDATTLAAKRIFAIGDPLLLERRAGALAGAIDVPIEALDLALANWAVGGAGGAEGAGGAGGRETRGWAADGLDEDCLARAREVLGL
jgi:hypothetical protein